MCFVVMSRGRLDRHRRQCSAAMAMLFAGLAFLTAHDAEAQKQPTPRPRSQGEAKATGGTSSGALTKRVEQLEEQLADMQVVVGTLESLLRSGAGRASGGVPSSITSVGDTSRMADLETQNRALTSQIEQLTERLRRLEGVARNAPTPPAAQPPSGDRRTSPPPLANPWARQQQPQPGTASQQSGFGTVTVTPGTPRDDANGSGIDRQVLPPTQGDATAKAHYERAYSFLLQQDYTAAQASFEDFLARYPSEQLAGNAQYWLGETLFVRARYKPAAEAFLKGYQTYAGSPKAPDSLLKLAMSLNRLGQKDAACGSFTELDRRYPNAAAHIRNRAGAERRRAGC